MSRDSATSLNQFIPAHWDNITAKSIVSYYAVGQAYFKHAVHQTKNYNVELLTLCFCKSINIIREKLASNKQTGFINESTPSI